MIKSRCKKTKEKETAVTDTTREIFHNHEIRKTKKQREAFREYAVSYAKSLGYEARVEKGAQGSRNIIVGAPSKAEVVYTAHYDTCAFMPLPNFITPKCLPIYILYQLILTFMVYIIPISVMIGSRHVFDATGSYMLFSFTLLGGYALLLAFTYLMMARPANKHTAKDNTSGVTLLFDIMTDMPNELRDKVAYIFFDLEERGTIGSKSYAIKHKALAKKLLVINFDCVSDGRNILFVVKKKARDISDKLAKAFAPNDTYSVEVATSGVFYPSDQRNFERGVGVAALNKTKHGILYMNKIHTPRDTVYDEKNISFLKNGAIKLTELLSQESV